MEALGHGDVIPHGYEVVAAQVQSKDFHRHGAHGGDGERGEIFRRLVGTSGARLADRNGACARVGDGLRHGAERSLQLWTASRRVASQTAAMGQR